MVTDVPAASRIGLNSRGYSRNGVELTEGWVDYGIPLYTHKQLTDKKPGDKAFDARVQNPKSLTSAEADYIARKGAAGFFAWKPETCFDHEFTNIQIVPRKGGGLIETRGEQVFGCKWCRANKNNGLQGEQEVALQSVAESAPVADSTPPAITPESSASEGVVCDVCHAVMKAKSSSGRPRTKKQQLHALKMHKNRKHQ